MRGGKGVRGLGRGSRGADGEEWPEIKITGKEWEREDSNHYILI